MAVSQSPDVGYRGRFAPSPTGQLHVGSLLAALASWLDARQHAGVWLVRIEDLDPPREIPGAAQQIIADLKRFGMESDETVMYQSRRQEAYEQALARLLEEGHAFDCGCMRRDLPQGKPYPGTCADGLPPERVPRSVRCRVPDENLCITDRIQGRYCQNPSQDSGAFIIRRADGLIAYQLAVVVDDADQGITDIVRGADLLSSTPRQCLIQQYLGLPRPRYAHIPVAVDAQGHKLSKQSMAQPVDATDPIPALRACWRMLGQSAELSADHRSVSALLRQMTELWSLEAIPARPDCPIG